MAHNFATVSYRGDFALRFARSRFTPASSEYVMPMVPGQGLPSSAYEQLATFGFIQDKQRKFGRDAIQLFIDSHTRSIAQKILGAGEDENKFKNIITALATLSSEHDIIEGLSGIYGSSEKYIQKVQENDPELYQFAKLITDTPITNLKELNRTIHGLVEVRILRMIATLPGDDFDPRPKAGAKLADIPDEIKRLRPLLRDVVTEDLRFSEFSRKLNLQISKMPEWAQILCDEFGLCVFHSPDQFVHENIFGKDATRKAVGIACRSTQDGPHMIAIAEAPFIGTDATLTLREELMHSLFARPPLNDADKRVLDQAAEAVASGKNDKGLELIKRSEAQGGSIMKLQNGNELLTDLIDAYSVLVASDHCSPDKAYKQLSETFGAQVVSIFRKLVESRIEQAKNILLEKVPQKKSQIEQMAETWKKDPFCHQVKDMSVVSRGLFN